MTPEEALMLAEDFEQAISAEDIEEMLPLTEGDGSVYRKDEAGEVNHEKVSTGAEHARVTFKMAMPKLQGPDFATFMEAAKHLTEKYGPDGYVKLYSPQSRKRVQLDKLQTLLADNTLLTDIITEMINQYSS